jgi:molybdate transport system ATP-binding protein
MSAETLAVRLSVAFGGFDLHVDETLELHGVTAVLGPSGSGKSTLLRAIAGFERPAAGRIACGDEVWFDSEAGVNLPAHRRPVGYMFQDARLFSHLDVAGNLGFAVKRRRRQNPVIELEGAVAALDLGPLLARRIGALSGGERQRVALARTLLAGPRLLLLDEPLSSLDRERKTDILPYLENLPKFSIPTIYVSHDIDEVAWLADRVLVLTGGRVQLHGTADAVLERLDLQPVAGRLEAGVLAEGTVARHDPRLRLTYVDLRGDLLTMPMIERVPPGQRVRLRIRARDVAIATHRPEGLSIRNVLPGTLTDIVEEPETGFAEVFVQLRSTRIRARLTRAATEALRLEKGMAVFALIKSVSFEQASLRPDTGRPKP